VFSKFENLLAKYREVGQDRNKLEELNDAKYKQISAIGDERTGM
jgi:hypothetical protein